MRNRIVLLALLIVSARAAAAQEHAHAGHDMARAGHVRFATSCNAAAQSGVDRGVTMMHSFWFEEAAGAFRGAARADSACAMARWGLAMSQLHPLWAAPTPAELAEGVAAVADARRLGAPTARERGWIEAAGAFYDSAATRSHAVRLRAWEQALARLHTAEPADTEATIDWALSLIATQSKTDTSYAQLRQAADLLEPLFAKRPEHPGLAHYLIHAYDAPALVARATLAANHYSTIAPDVPHALHMPSHSYSLLGMWDRSVTANRRSVEAGRRFEIAQGIGGPWYERLHATDYLVYAYLQQGRDRDALALVREAAAVDSVRPAGNLTAAFALAAIPVRYALERGDWRAAAALVPRPASQPLVQAVTAFANTLGAARTGDTATARAGVARLADLETRAAGGADPFAPSMIKVNRLAAEAWLDLAVGDTAAAVRAATLAAETEENSLKNPLTPGPLLSARELLGDMYAEAGRPADAAAAYRAALAQTPGRRRSVRGLASLRR